MILPTLSSDPCSARTHARGQYHRVAPSPTIVSTTSVVPGFTSRRISLAGRPLDVFLQDFVWRNLHSVLPDAIDADAADDGLAAAQPPQSSNSRSS